MQLAFRFIVLAFSAGIVFCGFGVPFFVSGGLGIVLGVVLVVGGELQFYFFERKTAHALDGESWFARLLDHDEFG